MFQSQAVQAHWENACTHVASSVLAVRDVGFERNEFDTLNAKNWTVINQNKNQRTISKWLEVHLAPVGIGDSLSVWFTSCRSQTHHWYLLV